MKLQNNIIKLERVKAFAKQYMNNDNADKGLKKFDLNYF
jgi:hypothetical protein